MLRAVRATDRASNAAGLPVRRVLAGDGHLQGQGRAGQDRRRRIDRLGGRGAADAVPLIVTRACPGPRTGRHPASSALRSSTSARRPRAGTSCGTSAADADGHRRGHLLDTDAVRDSWTTSGRPTSCTRRGGRCTAMSCTRPTTSRGCAASLYPRAGVPGGRRRRGRQSSAVPPSTTGATASAATASRRCARRPSTARASMRCTSRSSPPAPTPWARASSGHVCSSSTARASTRAGWSRRSSGRSSVASRPNARTAARCATTSTSTTWPRGIVAALESEHSGAIDIASGSGIAVRDLVLAGRARSSGREDLLRLGARPSPATTCRLCVGDPTEAARRCSVGRRRYRLADGIADTIAWGRSGVRVDGAYASIGLQSERRQR